MTTRIIQGDCLNVMRGMDGTSVHAVITDPPYGLGFMGQAWDRGVPPVEVWAEALRVLKPGGHLLAFGGTRMFHRLAVNIEDAGFELRDTVGLPHASGDWGDCPWTLAWVYGQGFPKSLDVSKAIEGAARPRDVKPNPRSKLYGDRPWMNDPTYQFLSPDPVTEDGRRWQGWGTALKPAWEPVILARKPLDGTVAANVLTHGAGALNIDGCRIGTEQRINQPMARPEKCFGGYGATATATATAGRWPANVILDGSPEVVGLMPETGPAKAGFRGIRHSGRHGGLADIGGNPKEGTDTFRGVDDEGGSAARYFYCAKASTAERGADNRHPTVKPIALMEYLVKLVTRPGDLVLDPFAGSGSTLLACLRLGREGIGIELNPEYVAMAERRIAADAPLFTEVKPG